MTDATPQKEAEKHLAESSQHKKMTEDRHFIKYVYHLFTNTPLYLHWQRILSYFRKFRAIAVFLRILTLLFTVIETGALVILSTALFLILLPFATALMLGILLTARIDSRRVNQKMKNALADKKIYVFFLPREEADFLSRNAQDLAKKGNGVILISPYWISSGGIKKGHFYFTVRCEEENLYLIRRYYFFSFRKQVLDPNKTVMVY